MDTKKINLPRSNTDESIYICIYIHKQYLLVSILLLIEISNSGRKIMQKITQAAERSCSSDEVKSPNITTFRIIWNSTDFIAKCYPFDYSERLFLHKLYFQGGATTHQVLRSYHCIFG
jgi:hypothetical protein